MRIIVLVLLLSPATGIVAHPGHGAPALHAHAPDWIMLVAICFAVAAAFALWKR